MSIYICHRIWIGIITIFCIITIVFFGLRMIPGDPAEVWLGDYSTPELLELTRAKWGLDKPLWIQYVTYTKNVLRGDLGESLRMKIPVAELLIRHYPFTIRLVVFGTFISIIIAVPLGIAASVRQNSLADVFIMVFSFLFISMPSFWLGLMVLIAFSFHLGWFPAIGGESEGNYLSYFRYLALPSICIGLREAGLLSRMVRSTMIDTLGKDYITVARSKGLSEHIIRYKHALRNALLPIISLIGVNMVLSLAGAVVLEVVFSRPGLGRLYVTAVSARDYPLIQGCVLLINPRIRYK
jgi:peptide/nickel transport system permease protein